MRVLDALRISSRIGERAKSAMELLHSHNPDSSARPVLRRFFTKRAPRS
jgi:hypothetical protein